MPRYSTPPSPCCIPDCDQPAKSHGLCAAHDARLRKHGTTDLAPKPSDEERFWAFVEKNDDGCWGWKGATNRGYGILTVYRNGKSRNLRAHRYSYQLHYGPITEGLWVLHHCDNPPCTRPDHLYLGTVQDNNRDLVARGGQVRGERDANAYLTEEIVREIRRRIAAGEPSRIVALAVNTPQANVRRVARRETWSHVE